MKILKTIRNIWLARCFILCRLFTLLQLLKWILNGCVMIFPNYIWSTVKIYNSFSKEEVILQQKCISRKLRKLQRRSSNWEKEWRRSTKIIERKQLVCFQMLCSITMKKRNKNSALSNQERQDKKEKYQMKYFHRYILKYLLNYLISSIQMLLSKSYKKKS